MNSLENIKYHEDVLNKYLSCSVKNKKIVFFGASMGLKWMRDSAAFMIPDYVCIMIVTNGIKKFMDIILISLILYLTRVEESYCL